MGPCVQLMNKQGTKVQAAENEDKAVDMEEKDPNEAPFDPASDPLMED